MLYLVGEQSTGYELEALWDDGAFGIKHWRHFERVAVVTDRAWLRAAVTMFAPLIPATVRLFAVSELPAAKDWIVAAKQASA